VALARETLSGPFPFRGLHDFPERADYGNAALARNVDFGDGWMRPRLGTDRVGRVADAVGADASIESFHLVRHFADQGASLLVTMAVEGTAPPEMRMCVDSAFKSSPSLPWRSLLLSYDGHRATACEWNVTIPRRLIVFAPASGQTVPSCVPLVVSAQAPYIEQLIPSGAAGADEGFYLQPNEQIIGDFGFTHEGRLFVGGRDGALRFSAAADLHAWPSDNNINEFGGQPLTGGASYNGNIIVFTRTSGHIVTFNGQDANKVAPLLHSTGCVHHNTIIEAARQLIWLADDGLVGLDASGNITEISKDIQRTLRSYAYDFPNASLVHYAARRQLWLLLPGPRKIFVLDLRTGDWSTHDWTDETVHPGSLALMPFAGIDRPICGARYKNAAPSVHKSGFVVAFEEGSDSDWMPVNRIRVGAEWLSLPIMSLGHHTPRLFRHWRIAGRDTGSDTARFYWLTQGQAGAAVPEVAGQYADAIVLAPSVTRRWGDGVAWWNTAGAYWPGSTGILDAPLRLSLAGSHTGRWIQLGVRKTAVAGTFALRSFELDSRRFEGRR
jgi:hypothetical protein